MVKENNVELVKRERIQRGGKIENIGVVCKNLYVHTLNHSHGGKVLASGHHPLPMHTECSR
jgi:hypothetical protein